MEFREVRSLATLAKTQSLAKTAKIVNLTPAAVYKQLKNLEGELGITLYEKDGRNIQVTQAATALLPHLEELLASHEAVNTAVTEWKGLGRGIIRIGANPVTSTILLPSLLHAYRKRWPNVTVTLDVDTGFNLSQRVGDRMLDLALALWDDPAQPRVVSRMAWDYEIVPVVSPNLASDCARMSDLAGEVHVRLPHGAILTSIADTFLKRHQLKPDDEMIVNNSHTLNALVCAGLGYGLLPKWAVTSELESGKLRVVPGNDRPMMGTLDLLSAKSGHVSPPVQAFIDLASAYDGWVALGLSARKLKKAASV